MTSLLSLSVRIRRVLPHTPLTRLLVAFLLHGLVLRLLTTSTILTKWANTHERAWWSIAFGLVVGALEDLCVAVTTSLVLWLCLRPWRPDASSPTLTAALVAVAFTLANAVFCIDLVILRTRRMRFTWDMVLLLGRENDAWTQLQVDEAEWLVACEMAAITTFTALVLGLRLDNRVLWRAAPLAQWDLELWNLSRLDSWCTPSMTTTPSLASTKDVQELPSDNATLLEGAVQSPSTSPGLVKRLGRMLVLWCLLTATTLLTSKLMSSLVAMLAWNASLCEPLRVVTGIDCMKLRSIHIQRQIRDLIDTTTESCTFVDDQANTLVRKTQGFSGPLAFDVTIQKDEQPNVLIVVIESFRQRDSRYLIHPSHLEEFLPANVSLTPHFDQWTKRGIGFRNMWSSWRTSRSLEQILFGQLPLDSATDSGTTNGRTTVRLSGLPQLLKAKGYETLFTTASRLDYDEWDVFLSTHGFDTCLNGWQLADIGQEEMGIDWTRGDHMMAYWGIHDDLIFEVLGHELKKKQRAKIAKEGKPWFAMHYTISSHVPFDERPDWFFRYRESDQMPDLSPLYASIKDPEIRELVQNYVEMRYFSDLTFGSFMGDLQRSGVLNDTIVIVTGDHGHSPENGVAMPEEDQVGAMNVPAALIAEGRLGNYTGTIIDNVTAQYDWLNTIADIVGLPETGDGFLQTGVGRSLKRKPLDDHRVVYSHNPALNLAAVQGHTRMEFYADVPDVVRVFNVERDPRRENDLRSDVPKSRLHEIEQICDEARALNAYFMQRWHANCLLPPHDCQQAPR